MKTYAAFRYFLTVTSLVAVLAMEPPLSRAEDKPAQIEGYDFVISNGGLMQDRQHGEIATLKVVAEALRHRYTNANIVFAPELANVQLPDLKLRAHNLSEMLEAIRVASGNKFDWMGPGSPGPNIPPTPTPGVDRDTGLPLTTIPDPSSGLWVLRPPAKAGQNERVVEAFNLEPFIKSRIRELQDYNLNITNMVDRMKFAVETSKTVQDLIAETVAGLEQVSANEARRKIEFSFHPGANLLVAVGAKEDVEVARKVVNALTGNNSVPERIREDLLDLSLNPGNGVRAKAAGSEPLSVEPITLKYSTMSSAWAAASNLLTDKRSKVVISDERTKTLIVMATKAEVSDIKKAIEQLEKASKPYVGDNPVVR